MPEENRELNIVVDGATGYVGNHLIAKLRRDRHQVRALVRPGANNEDLAFLQSCQAEIYQASFSEDNDTADALAGQDVAVHLIGSIAPKRGETLDDLHKQQTKRLVAQCKKAGVKKVVMVTALGADSQALSTYHQTKYLAEQCLRESGLKYVILRPSLIVGRLEGRRDSKLVRRYIEMILTKPRVPLINGGQNRIQPIFIKDLVECLSQAISSSAFDNMTLELGGREVLTMHELVEKLISTQSVNCRLVALPPGLAHIAAFLCETFQKTPLVSRDQVKLSLQDNVCSNNALTTLFAVKPTALSEALKTYEKAPRKSEHATSAKGKKTP